MVALGGRNLETLEIKMNNIIPKAVEWGAQNGLNFCEKKTQCMIISKKGYPKDRLN